MTLPNKPPTRDHIRPRSKGGTLADPSNRVIVCQPCNEDKGSLKIGQFLRRLDIAGDPRAVYVAKFAAQIAGRVAAKRDRRA